MPAATPAATQTERADKLRELAGQIRDNVFIAHHIADGFELIAAAMTPCMDCGEADKPAAEQAPAGYDTLTTQAAQ